MELTGFRDNIKSFMSVLDQEASLRKELKTLMEEKKKLTTYIISVLEMDKKTGVVYTTGASYMNIKHYSIEIKEKKRKDKRYKVLIVTNK